MEPKCVGAFQLLEKIGEGGMGVVWKALDTKLNRYVAIKFLPVKYSDSTERNQRFLQEARTASSLNHPNIVTIHSIEHYEERLFLVMEYIPGQTLSDVLRSGKIKLQQALRWAVEIASALSAAHKAGIVHRDLKPSNVMLNNEGRIKVLDFGLAKFLQEEVLAEAADGTTATFGPEPITESGAIVGSVPYMSPEQAEGKAIDHRTDIFSFGALLYELLAGKRAFTGESRLSTMAAIVERDPLPLSSSASGTVPLEVERVVAKCLRKDPSRRYQSMADVMVELEDILADSSSGKLASSQTMQIPGGEASKRPLLGWLVAAVVLVLAGGAFWWWAASGRNQDAEEPELVRITPNDERSYLNPTISPDGKFVAYSIMEGAQSQIWIQAVGSDSPVQLSSLPGVNDEPIFSADGASLFFVNQLGASFRSTLYKMSILGGTPSPVYSTNGLLSFPIPATSEPLLYFYSHRFGEVLHLYRLDLLSGHTEEIEAYYRWQSEQGRQLVRSRVLSPSEKELITCTLSVANRPSSSADCFAVPLKGGKPWRLPFSDALSGLKNPAVYPALLRGNELFFYHPAEQLIQTFSLPIDPSSWQALGRPKQLFRPTEYFGVFGAAKDGVLVANTLKTTTTIYYLPWSNAQHQSFGTPQKLVRDGFDKALADVGGDPSKVFYRQIDLSARVGLKLFSMDAAKKHKTHLWDEGLESGVTAISRDGSLALQYEQQKKGFATFLLRLDGGNRKRELLCEACGMGLHFSLDNRFVLLLDSNLKESKQARRSIQVLDLETRQRQVLATHPAADFFGVGLLGSKGDWFSALIQNAKNEFQIALTPFTVPLAPWDQWIYSKEFSPMFGIREFGPLDILFWKDDNLYRMTFDLPSRQLSEAQKVDIENVREILQPNAPFRLLEGGVAVKKDESQGSVWLVKPKVAR